MTAVQIGNESRPFAEPVSPACVLQSHPMLQLDVGATSPPEVDAAESFFELSFPTPKSLKANHEWVDSSTLDQLRRDVEQLQDLVTRQQQRAERHTGAGSRADSSLGASRPESPKALDDAAALRLPYDVRLLQGRAAAAGEAPPRPWGEANLRQTEAVSVPYAQPRVLDLTVPSLEQPPGAVGTASPLRLLRRPRLDDCECGSDTAPLLLPPTVAVPLSEEAQALKTMFEARVAAVESRLQLALGEVLRESANLRLAVPPPAAPALASSHGQAATWREEVLESELVPHRGDGRPVPGSRAAVALTPFSAADTDAMCVARAEADDPFVVLLTWASDRPARLADMLGEAAGEGTASLTRGSLNALIRDTLVPGIDARGLRYVNLVLDCCQAQPPATNGDGGVTIAAFVAAIREGATAGASARATFHAPMAELMDRLAKSMDSHSQAWAFSSKCLPGGAFTATQLVLNANQLLPGGLLPRHKTLLAAQVHADASFGGPRHVFTLQQARQLCVPRHDRVAARKRVLAARVAYEHGARAPEKEVVMPLHPRPPPPPYVVDPPPRSTAGGAATSVSAAEQAALRQFAAATASVTRAAERVPPEAPLPPVTHSTQPPSELHVAHSVARAAVSELRSAETAKHHGPSPSGSRHHHASPRHKSGHPQQQHHHHRGVTTGSVDAQDMAGYALPPPGQEPKHQSIEQWLRTGGQPLGGGGAHAAEVHVPEKPAAHISTSVSGHAAAILKLQAAAAMAARLAVDAAAVRNEITLGLADAGKVETRLRGGKPWH